MSSLVKKFTSMKFMLAAGLTCGTIKPLRLLIVCVATELPCRGRWVCVLVDILQTCCVLSVVVWCQLMVELKKNSLRVYESVECCDVVSVDGGDKEEQPACVSESVECCDVVSGDGGDKEEQPACV